MKMLCLPAVIARGAVMLFLVVTSQGAIKTWTGKSLFRSMNWSDASNWLPTGAPKPGDSLVFPTNYFSPYPSRPYAILTNDLPTDTAFVNVTLGSDRYILTGNRIVLNSQFTAIYPSNKCDYPCGLMSLSIRLGGNATLSTSSRRAGLMLNRDIDLNGHSLVLSTRGELVVGNINLNGGQLFAETDLGGRLEIAGIIQGTGSVTKRGPGLCLFGVSTNETGFGLSNGPNTYTGTTFVQEGTLKLRRRKSPGPQNEAGFISIPHNLVIGTPFTSARVEADMDGQIQENIDVTLYDSALVLAGTNSFGSLFLTKSSLYTGDQLAVTGPLKVFPGLDTKTTSWITGNLWLGSGRRICDIASGASLEIRAGLNGLPIKPAPTLVKTNSGDLRLESQFQGGSENVVVEAHHGRITVCHHDTPLDLHSATLQVECSSPWKSLRSFGIGSRMTWAFNGMELDRPIFLAQDIEIFCDSGQTNTLSGSLTGPSGFRKTGEGSLVMEALRFDTSRPKNNFTGTGLIEGGELVLKGASDQSPLITGPLVIGTGTPEQGRARVRYATFPEAGTNQIADQISLTILADGSLEMAGLSETLAGLAGDGIVDLGPGGRLTLQSDGTNHIFGGTIKGSGIISKSGTSRLVLNGNHAFRGTLEVAEGILAHNGSSRGVTANVAQKATLTGHGTLATVRVDPGATLSPSVSGTNPCTVLRILNLDHSIYDIQLFGGNRRSHQLRAEGTVTLGESLLRVTTPTGTIPTVGQSYVILDMTGSTKLQDRFLNLSEGAYFQAAGVVFQITYRGGDGNDIVITRRSNPFISSLKRVGGDLMHVQGQGEQTAIYILETTPHFNHPIVWVPIATNTANTSGLFELIDPEPFFDPIGNPRHPSRFYRVRSL